MLSPEYIVDLSRKAGKRARLQNLTPYVPFDVAEVNRVFEHSGEGIFPFLGDYRPVGWELVDYATVDATGWGLPSEPAWTQKHLFNFIVDSIETGKRYGWAVIEAGEFQVVVGWFVRTKEYTDTRPSPFADWYKCEPGVNEI